MRDLRQTFGRAALLASASALVCDLAWQGDFGAGIPTGSGVWSDPGVNPCVLLSPPAAAAGGGIPQPQFKPGMIVNGDYGAEFVLCRLTLAGATDLLPGDCYFLDGAYNLTLFSTTNANNVIGAQVVVGQVFAPATPAGTYFLWAQRAGNSVVRVVAGSVNNGQGETNATAAGTMKFPASATASQKSAGPAQAVATSVTFTANTATGSPYLTAVASASSGGGVTDLVPGMTITGTGLPANSCIAAIDKVGGQWRLTLGTSTTGAQRTTQNATANGTGVTFTVTSHLPAVLYWPTLNKQN